MKTEFEKRYYNFDNQKIRSLLDGRDEVLSDFTKRIIYDISDNPRRYLRVRDESGFVKVTLKQIIDPSDIKGTQEIEFYDEDMKFEDWLQFFKLLGLKERSYQETIRETFLKYNCTITIDTWPGLRPVLEIEGEEVACILDAEKELGLDNLSFPGDIPDIYAHEYGITREEFNAIPELTFNNYLDVLRKK